VEDVIIKIEFVRLIDNDSDIFTKNVNQEIYEKHVKNFLEDSGEEYGDGTFRHWKGIGNIPHIQLSLDLYLLRLSNRD
jgi:hypothetical protein